MRVAPRLSVILLVVMLTQALMGLAFQAAYLDVEWIRATWFGNDWVTLVVAVPLLFVGLLRTAVGSARGLLLWLGLIGYALYNYSFYLFGAALNAFLPIYVVALVLAVTVLILALSQIDAVRFAHSLRPTAPVRLGCWRRADLATPALGAGHVRHRERPGCAVPVGAIGQLHRRHTSRPFERSGRAANLGNTDRRHR